MKKLFEWIKGRKTQEWNNRVQELKLKYGETAFGIAHCLYLHLVGYNRTVLFSAEFEAAVASAKVGMGNVTNAQNVLDICKTVHFNACRTTQIVCRMEWDVDMTGKVWPPYPEIDFTEKGSLQEKIFGARGPQDHWGPQGPVTPPKSYPYIPASNRGPQDARGPQDFKRDDN